MSVIDRIRGMFSAPCQLMVKYQARTFEFVPAAVEAGPVKVSLGEIKTHVEKIEEAGEMAKMIDMYQFAFCKAALRLPKGRQQKYAELRIGVLGILTSLHACLLAFKANPDGQRERLDQAVQVMQEFMRNVANQALFALNRRPRRKLSGKRAVGRAMTAGESLPKVRKSGEPSLDSLFSINVRPKASDPTHPGTLSALVKSHAMFNAFKFAGLERSDVNRLARELSRKTQTPR